MDQKTRDDLKRLINHLSDAHYDLGRQEALGMTGGDLAELKVRADGLVDQARSEIDKL